MPESSSQKLNYTGVIPILPTPFFADEEVDFDSLVRLAAFAASAGQSGLTILGVLGEANSLTDAEATAIVREVCSAATGLPVIVGAGRPGVRSTRTFIAAAAELGAAAAMVAPPSMDGASETLVTDYFSAVATASPIPVIIQDHPASTRVHISAAVIARLIRELDEVIGLKCEAVPTGPKIRAVKALAPQAEVMTGLGALYAATDLAAGSDGFNTGFAFPEVLVALRRLAAGGDFARARALYRKFLPLIVLEQHPGPAVRKEIWRRRGVIASARVRSPGVQLDSWLSGELTTVLADTFGAADLAGAAPLPVC